MCIRDRDKKVKKEKKEKKDDEPSPLEIKPEAIENQSPNTEAPSATSGYVVTEKLSQVPQSEVDPVSYTHLDVYKRQAKAEYKFF